MAWTLDSDRPIFLQIVERIQTDIVSGRYQPGDKLPSVRDLAAEASVNPNTMQKAFYEEVPFHPERLLANLICVFHPAVAPQIEQTVRYYEPLAN